MPSYEYRVVPAPVRGEKVRGAKTTQDRFAHALMAVMNELGRDGWEYLRADTLPCEERVGFTGTKTTFQNMLVFRRAVRSLGEDLPDRPAMRVFSADAGTPGPRLGPAEMPEGAAPALGPAKGELAAE